MGKEKIPCYTEIIQCVSSFKGVQASHLFTLFMEWIKENYPGRKVTLSQKSFSRNIQPYCESKKSSYIYYIPLHWKELDIRKELIKYLEERDREFGGDSVIERRKRMLS